MTRLSEFSYPEDCPRIHIVYGPGIADVFCDQDGNDYPFLEAFTADLQAKWIDRVIHISPTKPVHTIDAKSKELASHILWPPRERILETGIISGIATGPLGEIKPVSQPNPGHEARGIGDLHGIRMVDQMMKEPNRHRTGFVIFHAEEFFSSFDSLRVLNGLVGEWITLGKDNHNLLFLVFMRHDNESLENSLSNVNFLGGTELGPSNSSGLQRMVYLGYPKADEIERLVRNLENRRSLTIDKEDTFRVLHWMEGEKVLLRQWAARLSKIDFLSVDLLVERNWVSARAGDARSFEEKINDLVGQEQVKQRLLEIKRWMEYSHFEVNSTSIPNLHMIFSGNPGTGKTTFARLMGEMFHEYGLLRSGHVVEAKPADMVADHVGGTGTKTNQLIDQALDGVLFIDEAYGLSEEGRGGFGQEALENLLVRMESDKSRLVVVLAGYTDRMSQFLKSNTGLNRRFPEDNRLLFEDFSTDQLVEILLDQIKKKELAVEEDVCQRLKTIVDKMLAEKRFGFGNAGEMINLADGIERKAKARLSSSGAQDQNILTQDIPDRYRFYLQEEPVDIEDVFKEFKRFVGLDNIRGYLRSLVSLIQYERIKAELTGQQIPIAVENFIFKGNPGTGKTSVAKLIGKIFHRLGLLPSERVLDISAADLVAGYVGQTPAKTVKLFEDALGGVLFIDEAYAITRQASGLGAGYGMEVIDTLVKKMDEYKHQLIVIAAGYPEEMDDFVRSNPGIASRFSAVVEFPDLTVTNLLGILSKKIEDEAYQIDEDVLDYAGWVLESVKNQSPRTFGNAREVNTLFLFMKRNLAERVMANTQFERGNPLFPAEWNKFLKSDLSGYVRYQAGARIQPSIEQKLQR